MLSVDKEAEDHALDIFRRSSAVRVELNDLTGHILATLQVNFDRSNILFQTPEAHEDFRKILAAWTNRFKQI